MRLTVTIDRAPNVLLLLLPFLLLLLLFLPLLLLVLHLLPLLLPLLLLLLLLLPLLLLRTSGGARRLADQVLCRGRRRGRRGK